MGPTEHELDMARMVEDAMFLERRVINAVLPVVRGHDARSICAAMLMAASGIARASGMPHGMFSVLAECCKDENRRLTLAGKAADDR